MVVHNLATALTRIGHNVVVVAPKSSRNKMDISFDYDVFKYGFKGSTRFRLTSLLAVSVLLYVVKKFAIDVIHVHDVYNPGKRIRYFQLFVNNIPVIGTPHGDDIQITPQIQDGVRLNPKSDKIVRQNLAAFKCITAISASVRKDLDELVDNKEKIIDVPNGVWIKDFQKNINRTEIRKKFNIPLDSIAIISVGRNHIRKGFIYGLEAAAKLRNAEINISYILVGRDMSPIIDKAKSLGVSDCLITPGEVNNETVSQLLQSSDIFVSPSIVESFGINTLEAMCAGLPCVVTDVPGTRDLVSQEYGLFVKPSDSDQLANAIKYLIENPSICTDIASRARMEAQKYDWMKIAEMYQKVYKDVIAA